MNLQTIPHSSFPEYQTQLIRAVGNTFPGFGFSPAETERFLNGNAAPFDDIHYFIEQGEEIVAVAMRCGNLLEYVIPVEWESRYETVAESIRLVGEECPTLQIRIRETIPSHASWYAGLLPSLGFEMTPRMRMETTPGPFNATPLMPSGYSLAAMRPEWIDACVAIHDSALPGSGENVRESLEAKDRRESWFVALYEDRPVGSGFGSHYRGRLFIEELAIDESHRNRGLGKQLVLSVIAALSGTFPEAEKVILDVDRQNAPAVGLYRSLRFSRQDFYTVARLYH